MLEQSQALRVAPISTSKSNLDFPTEEPLHRIYAGLKRTPPNDKAAMAW
jgi:hypothetical protein